MPGSVLLLLCLMGQVDASGPSLVQLPRHSTRPADTDPIAVLIDSRSDYDAMSGALEALPAEGAGAGAARVLIALQEELRHQPLRRLPDAERCAGEEAETHCALSIVPCLSRAIRAFTPWQTPGELPPSRLRNPGPGPSFRDQRTSHATSSSQHRLRRDTL